MLIQSYWTLAVKYLAADTNQMGGGRGA